MTIDDIKNADDKTIKSIVTTKLKKNSLTILEKLIDAEFFIAPASVSNHGNITGGLARHSVMVTYLFTKLLELNNIEMSEKDILICGLLHDLCKTKLYTMDDIPPTVPQLNFFEKLIADKQLERETIPRQAFQSKSYISEMINWLKSNMKDAMPVYDKKWQHVETKPPLEHGVLSLFMAKEMYPNLSIESAAIIRWHMGLFDLSAQEQRQFGDAATEVPQVLLFANADHQASVVHNL
ncbi:MAG: hypothetical protein KAS32_07145 [Candidatus Peribacteraceae bacterium]|nr:hypothetical protein [Candidatus Peribacteraceae bacterium]